MGHYPHGDTGSSAGPRSAPRERNRTPRLPPLAMPGLLDDQVVLDVLHTGNGRSVMAGGGLLSRRVQKAAELNDSNRAHWTPQPAVNGLVNGWHRFLTRSEERRVGKEGR